VHGLVMRSFVGPPPAGMEICHNDGLATNCRLDNLRYDTPTNNHADKIKHGTTNRGERQGSSRLKNEDVRKILALGRSVPQRVIGEMFSISPTHVCNILNRKAWQYLPEAEG
jgi:hypothetical protein